MTKNELIIEAYGRIQSVVQGAVKGLSEEQLAFRPEGDANSIAWLVWHLARVQDDHLADVAGRKQVWTEAGWADKFSLPFDASATGYGQHPEEVAAVRVSADLLIGYYDAVHAKSLDYISKLTDADYDKVVDTRWDPPVTLAVRLVSVLSDCLQHAGQAAYVRGLIK